MSYKGWDLKDINYNFHDDDDGGGGGGDGGREL
jgi:hypothetical protein